MSLQHVKRKESRAENGGGKEEGDAPKINAKMPTPFSKSKMMKWIIIILTSRMDKRENQMKK